MGFHVDCITLQREVFTHRVTHLIQPTSVVHPQCMKGKWRCFLPGVAACLGCWLGLVSECLSKPDKNHIVCSTRRQEGRHFSPSQASRVWCLEPEREIWLPFVPSDECKRHLNQAEWRSWRRVSIKVEMDGKVLVQIAGETKETLTILRSAVWPYHPVPMTNPLPAAQHPGCHQAWSGFSGSPWGRKASGTGIVGRGLPQELQRADLSQRAWPHPPSPREAHLQVQRLTLLSSWSQSPGLGSSPTVDSKPRSEFRLLHLLNCSTEMEFSPNATGLLGEIVQGYKIPSEGQSILYHTIISMAISSLSKSLRK